ncbi:MAG: hypothetical protein JWN04_4904, partial [Myxococcaceae bacterium]|nr:hypothetical protein [Myxococcaceae bacterium]
MLFIVMHKVDAATEAGLPPDPQLVANMGALIGETIEKGLFHNAAGLKGSAQRIRLRWRGGKRELTRGPLSGENELVAGLAMLQVKSLDEAVAWTTRIAEIEGCHDVEFDLGPLVESWDLGFEPKPTGDIPLRVLAVRKADSHSEAGTAPSAEIMTKMQALLSEMKAAGVLLAVEGLKPSARGARLQTRAG